MGLHLSGLGNSSGLTSDILLLLGSGQLKSGIMLPYISVPHQYAINYSYYSLDAFKELRHKLLENLRCLLYSKRESAKALPGKLKVQRMELACQYPEIAPNTENTVAWGIQPLLPLWSSSDSILFQLPCLEQCKFVSW